MSKCMAGIVLYNAEIERLLSGINSIVFQVDLVLLYDNGSENIDIIKKKVGKIPKVVIIQNSNNLGIGFASNKICEFALENGYEWVLLLDHDTICPNNIIQEYSKFILDNKVGIICPKVKDKEIVKNVYCYDSNKETEFVSRCIQTASLIRVDAWKKCDGFSEWMFIDFVDFDFCKRMQLNKFEILKCNNVVVDHQLGARIDTKFSKVYEKIYQRTKLNIFKYLTYKNVYTPTRVFYCTRNNIAYIKIYKDSLNLAMEWKDFLLRIIRRIIRSKNKLMIIKETLKGVIAGMKYKVDRVESKKD